MSDEATYDVLTWNMNKQAFTPQRGLRPGPWRKWEIRTAIRQLRAMGYDANRQDSSVLVERRKA